MSATIRPRGYPTTYGNGVFDGSGVAVTVGVKVNVGCGVEVGVSVLVGVGDGPRVNVGTGVRVGVSVGGSRSVGVIRISGGYSSSMAVGQSRPSVRTNSVKRVPPM
ncbi:MAG: hypothetical protein B6D40_01660 [Anaerolineae bacterium UTCFX3]|nr:MAG: hypothetical protein B6D40_01660 [Anaerolineae bacterium UTCFX3]